jgi:type IV pilus assembly protein PilX
MMPARLSTCRSSQRGAVLIVTLLFLVILTMLGVTAMSGTTMEERMAGNARDGSIALQAAEAALRDARRDINNIQVVGGGRGIPLHASMFGDSTSAAETCNGDKPGLCLPARNPDGTEYSKTPASNMPSVPKHNMKAAPSVAYGAFTGATAIGGLPTQPRYVIEVFCLQQHGESLDRYCNFYRITAVGYGRNPNTTVRLQETFLSL